MHCLTLVYIQLYLPFEHPFNQFGGVSSQSFCFNAPEQFRFISKLCYHTPYSRSFMNKLIQLLINCKLSLCVSRAIRQIYLYRLLPAKVRGKALRNVILKGEERGQQKGIFISNPFLLDFLLKEGTTVCLGCDHCFLKNMSLKNKCSFFFLSERTWSL